MAPLELAPSPRWTLVAFALAPLLLGNLPPALLFPLDPTTGARIGVGEVPIPVAVFTLVWVVAYPMMGVAAWLVWRKRTAADVSVPLAIFGAAYLQTLSFWFTNSIRMTALIDATGVVLAFTVAWVFSRYERRAVGFLLPWLLWMPTTLGFKLWALAR